MPRFVGFGNYFRISSNETHTDLPFLTKSKMLEICLNHQPTIIHPISDHERVMLAGGLYRTPWLMESGRMAKIVVSAGSEKAQEWLDTMRMARERCVPTALTIAGAITVVDAQYQVIHVRREPANTARTSRITMWLYDSQLASW